MDPITSFRGDYWFLSNFYPVPPGTVELDGVFYASVEHAYQAAKTENQRERWEIRRCVTAGMAKRLGRRVTVRPDWDQQKRDRMQDLLRQKFAVTMLRDLLAATAPALLIEGNSWGDTYWGAVADTDGGWLGENWLGVLLMEIRDEIFKREPWRR